MIHPLVVFGISSGVAGIALLVGWYSDKEPYSGSICKLHSWSESVLDGKMYCMDCNKQSPVSTEREEK